MRINVLKYLFKVKDVYWINKREYKPIEHYDYVRQRNHQFYLSKKWRQVRLTVLSEFPICNDCQIEPSYHVHHQQPLYTKEGWSNRLNVFLDDGEQNLFGLCLTCHNKRDAEIRLSQRIDERMNDLNNFE